MKKNILSWNEVKKKYLEFHKMDSFTENMAIDIDFGYWLVNNCITHDVINSLLEDLKGFKDMGFLPSDTKKGWADENCHNPKKNGEYLCLVKWYNSSEYKYAVLEYDRKTKWQVTDSCEHILWSELPPSPFS